jgi:hypothetical protein
MRLASPPDCDPSIGSCRCDAAVVQHCYGIHCGCMKPKHAFRCSTSQRPNNRRRVEAPRHSVITAWRNCQCPHRPAMSTQLSHYRRGSDNYGRGNRYSRTDGERSCYWHCPTLMACGPMCGVRKRHCKEFENPFTNSINLASEIVSDKRAVTETSKFQVPFSVARQSLC